MTFQSLSRWLLLPILAIGLFFASPHAKEYFQASISTAHQTTISPTEVSLESSSKGIFTVQMKNFSGNPVKISLTADDASKVMIFPNKRTIKTNKKYLFFVFTDGGFNSDTTIKVKNEGGEEMASVKMKKKVSTSSQPTQNPNCVDPGQGFWEVPSECLPAGHAKVTVKEGVEGSRTFVPNDDRFTGTFYTNEIWSLRHPYSGSVDQYLITLSPAEGGETTVSYDGALSRIPGSFTQTIDQNGQVVSIPTFCTLKNKVTADAYARRRDLANAHECPLDAGKTYYWNIRVNSTQSCGTGGMECRTKSHSTIPHSSPYPTNPFPAGYASSIPATPSPTPSPTQNPNCTDPNTEQWNVPSTCWPDDKKVTVKQGISGGSVFVPENDRFTGSFKNDEVWSVRYHYANISTVQSVAISRPNSGETVVRYDVAFSRVPGSFTETLDASGNSVPIEEKCKISNVVSTTLSVAARGFTGSRDCPIDIGETYYWNIRASGSSGCGTEQNPRCRLAVFSTIQQ